MEEIGFDGGNHWRTVLSGVDVRCYFEGKAKISVPVGGPQIYRFLFSWEGGLKGSYIGETDNFKRRMCRYRASQPTNFTERHVRGHLGACVPPGTVELQVLEFSYLDFQCVRILKPKLDRQHVRRLLESWSILRDERAGLRILNANRDTSVHPTGEVAKKSSRAERYRMLDELGRKNRNAA